ncbi:hypothetical protein [Arthrobacter sp. GMC3]|uniref:hypothetical protein n=1 Tax=Arthrobacter sp. GMC3 TaxID=2058894 RepID=UPI000CE4093A|nr:hypothetical protein [Arthrobacter sp. GMC3]
MTVDKLIQLCAKRWYVFIVVLTCATAAIFGLNTNVRLYTAQVEFIMVSPGTSVNFGMADETRVSLVNFADIVVREFNDKTPTYSLSAPKASLFGNGIRDGISVRLADSGTQWSPSFGTPVITVQIISSSPDQVLAKLDEISTRIQDLTSKIQSDIGASPATFIKADFDRTSIDIHSFGPTRAGKLKAEVTIIAVAFCLSTIIAEFIDRRWPKRSRKPMRQVINESKKTRMVAS